MTLLHICHFLNYMRNGGTEEMVLSLIRHSRHKHTYVTYSAAPGRLEALETAGGHLVEVGEGNI